VLECVVNLSEGRRDELIDDLAAAAGRDLLDVHRDGDHHRSVLTLVGEAAPRAVTARAVEVLDLRTHAGAHPRFGVVDVVPFVPLGSASLDDAIEARDRFASWAAADLGVPCFLYGPERSLPEVRRRAFHDLAPDQGPERPDPSRGAIAVGARPVLVAYNLWLEEPDLALARRVAAELRRPEVRALGLAVGTEVQVSMNLVAPLVVGPAVVYDAVAARTPIARAELVGLAPSAVVEAVPAPDRVRLDLSLDRTIEARLERRRSAVS
jgi:glutamate formiminotransferase